MSYTDAMKQIKKQLPHVLLVYGTEVYFIQKIKDAIIKKLKVDIEDIANYDLTEVPIQEVISDAETFPFFAEKKLIFANDPTFIKAKPDKLPFEHDVDSLVQYIKNPVDFTVLVIIAPYEKLDERKKALKTIRNHALVADCNQIKDYEIKNWIHTIAEQLRIQITPDALHFIETELANNLHLLENELKKLALYVGEEGQVTREIAELLVSHTVDSSALRLVDTVIEGDLQKAITIYKDLEKMKEEPIALIALLGFQFRNILKVKLLKRKGYSQFQMQKQLGAHPYVVKVALSRENKFTVEKLQSIISQLAETDRSIKQGRMEKELAFELLLYQIIQPAATKIYE